MLGVGEAAARDYAPADVPNVQLADSNAYVADPDGLLGPAAVGRINEMARQIRLASSAEPYVAVIGSTGGEDIDEFATELFGLLGLGKSDKDNGLLFVVARDDRRAAIRTGYGLEGVLPDAVCSRILRRKAFPLFKAGQYDKGVVAAFSAIADVLTAPDNIAEIHSAQADNRPGRRPDDDSLPLFNIYLYFAVLMTAVRLVVFSVMLVGLRGTSD